MTPVETITAFLRHKGGNDDPVPLKSNADQSFIGSYVLGMGFTFDDTDTKGIATPLAEMRRLIDKEPRNQEVIFPYIGYAEVATSPTHSHHRFVVNFGERSEVECRKYWPDLLEIVENKVKPERLKQNDRGAKEKWWQYIRPRPELHAAIAGLKRVLVAGSQRSAHFAFAFLPRGMVYSSNLTVIALETYSAFCALQSRIHEVWSLYFMTTLGDSLVYTPTTCFETYPFCENWQAQATPEKVGQTYYEYRAHLMMRMGAGLTDIYNLFHDPNERDPEIEKLRELHAAMDRAVLDAYGWSGVPIDCKFLLDYEIDEEEWGDKKKPYRCRWPDEVRDEVLARLLELNAERAKEEAGSGAAAVKTGSKKLAHKRATKAPKTEDLFS